MKNLLGGKGANLAEMASLGLPVPPGFTLTTDVCTYYYDNGEQYPDDMNDQIAIGLGQIEKSTGKVFGDSTNPLLVSVRSGARASMPGMMDTVLNLGLNDETVEERALGRDFPQDPREQLQGAVDAVFGSWMNDRAIVYRRLNDIPAAWGTAVNVQAMVFGNMGETSATGVAFTRDPSTGDNRYYGRAACGNIRNPRGALPRHARH